MRAFEAGDHQEAERIVQRFLEQMKESLDPSCFHEKERIAALLRNSTVP